MAGTAHEMLGGTPHRHGKIGLSVGAAGEVMTMKAIYIEEHGSVRDLRVSEIPVPAIEPGEVLVRVEASGINPSDIASVEGRFSGSVLPRVVGRDFAGKIVDGPADLLGTEV